MAFSGALTLTDLNDYLGPSQACIKPIESGDADLQSQDNATAEDQTAGAASTQIAIDRDGSYYESSSQKDHASANLETGKPRQRTKLETAEISLNDCLACSGCVTSAESVLITMQSQEEMRRAIEEMRSSDQRKLLVASVSPQTLASLSARYSIDQPAPSTSSTQPGSLPMRTLLHRISHFLKTRFQFDFVLDTTFARHLSLKEHEREFFERRANTLKRKRGTRPEPDLPPLQRTGKDVDEPTLPMLASACPGWICYAEKTHGELLPFIAKTKSPQQISGVLANKFIPSRLGVGHESGRREASNGQHRALSGVYHVTVMPCYDKKLEASRPDFFEEITGTKEVDCVLTTGELDRLMRDEGFDIQRPVPGEAELDRLLPSDLTLSEALKGGAGTLRQSAEADGGVTVLPHFPTMLDQPGSSSGGYLFHLMKAVWRDWLGDHRDLLSSQANASRVLPQLDVKIIRTSDFTEYVLRAPPLPAAIAQAGPDASAQPQSEQSPIIFRAAQCYGFRNLQNLVRKLQRQAGVKSAKGAAGRLVDSDGNAVANGSGGRGRTVRGRGRGMIRRGRGGASAASGSPTARGSAAPETGSGAATPVMGDADEEEAYGYDYVEVMACPGGCVNGGGQMRPPTDMEAVESSEAIKAVDGDEEEGTINKSCSKRETDRPKDPDPTRVELDPEGFSSGWASDQNPARDPSRDIKMLQIDAEVKVDGSHAAQQEGSEQAEEKEVKGWQGTSKEWVRRVERAYWASSQFSHTPVNAAHGSTSASGTSTPLRNGRSTLESASHIGAATSKREARHEDRARILEALVSQQSMADSDRARWNDPSSVQPDSLAYADLLAELVTKELCAVAASLFPPKGHEELEAALTDARKKLFRTEYRAVKDELVSGLAVQW